MNQPEVEKAENVKCNILKDGLCNTHNCMTSKVTVTAKKWKDRGKGRGYGYVNSKVTKAICMGRKLAPTVTKNYPDNLDLSSNGGISEHRRGLSVSEERESSIIRANEDV